MQANVQNGALPYLDNTRSEFSLKCDVISGPITIPMTMTMTMTMTIPMTMTMTKTGAFPYMGNTWSGFL